MSELNMLQDIHNDVFGNSLSDCVANFELFHHGVLIYKYKSFDCMVEIQLVANCELTNSECLINLVNCERISQMNYQRFNYDPYFGWVKNAEYSYNVDNFFSLN